MAITAIAELSDVKNYLRIPLTNTIDDAILTDVFMPAAQQAVEREIGHVVKKVIRAERHDGGKAEVWLRQLPVLYVENVQEGWGYYNWNLDDQEVNTQPALSIWAYSLDRPQQGLLTRRGPGNVLYPFVWGRNNIRVDYVVGRTEMPSNAVLVFCELIGYWYRQSQLRTTNQVAAAFNPSILDTNYSRTTGEESVNMGVPESIIELLKPDRRRPVIG